MLVKDIENSIKEKNTQNFLNIIKQMSVKDFLTADQTGLAAIHLCVKHNAMKELLILLDSIPVNEQNQVINQKTKGLCPKTPLQIASENHNDKVTKFLIERGADLTEHDIDKIAKEFKHNTLFLSYLNGLKDTKFKKEKKFWFF